MASDSDSSDGSFPGGISSKDARTRFAELLRRAEYGKERIRLTRRGKPIAYVVPLEDVERLKRFEEQFGRFEVDAYPDLMDDPAYSPDPIELEDEPPQEMAPSPLQSFPQEMGSIIDHGDESERDAAIAAFRKGLHRIFGDSEKLEPADMAARLRSDSYVGSTIRRILGKR